MKKKFLYVMALAALVSCSSDEFVGDGGSPNIGANGEKAISFGSSAAKVTRATSNSGTVSVMLDGQFLLYGTKNVKNASDQDVYSIVFPNYVAWNKSGLTATTSNPDGNDASNGWEYVGTTSTTYGASSTALTKEQTIKYWDYSAANYHFVAGSPVANFQYTITNNDIASATVTGLGGHISANPVSGSGTALSLNPVYIAKPVTVLPTNYNSAVTFEFVRQQARVRVGVYETIPGYKITNIKFYTYTTGTPGSWSANPNNTQNIILNSATADYFVGGSASATVTYNWSGNESGVSYPNYTFAYSSGLTQQNSWYGGLLNGVKAITSNHTTIDEFYGTDKDMDANGYFTVIPTPSGTTAQPIIIKCDYTLAPVNDSEGSNETITIHGATAAVPAAFSKWAPNTSYTYLFKISDNTNGKTNPSLDPVGLFPITFDAVVMTEATGTEQGYITTVSTPSITTYQEGSVTSTGIKYVPGSGKVIYFTVQDDTDGTLKTLKTSNDGTVGCVKVFWLGNTAKTEADLQLAAPESSAVLSSSNPSGSTALELPSSAWSHNGQSIASGNYGTFTPGAEGYYAIQYLTTAAGANPAAYTYKVVHVETATP